MTCAPAGQTPGVGLDSLMEAADQRRQDVAVGGVVVVARPIEIGGHEADRIAAMLLAQRLAELDAGDLGDRVPLIRRFQRSSKQYLLTDRLLGELRVEQQLPRNNSRRTPERQAVSIAWVWILRFSSRKSAG